MKGHLVVFILIVTLFFSGCFAGHQKGAAPLLTNTLTPPTNGITGVSTIVPSQTYKTVDLVMSLPNTYPVYGFKMDYPSEWIYKPERSKTWRAGYKFSSPDDKSHVYVFVDDTSGSAYYWYNTTTWANNVMRVMTLSYCHDQNGNPTDCRPENNARDYYHLRLISNDPVTIPGCFEARKLVFKSNDDPYFGQDIRYIMHAGTMQRYLFRVPDHYEIGVKTDGPEYDYGVGGQGYTIDFYAPAGQVDATSEIFDHMINSFKVTS